MAMRAGSTFRSAGSAWIIPAIMPGSRTGEALVGIGPEPRFVIGASGAFWRESEEGVGVEPRWSWQGRSVNSVISGAGVCGKVRAGMDSAGGPISSTREENRLLSHASIS